MPLVVFAVTFPFLSSAVWMLWSLVSSFSSLSSLHLELRLALWVCMFLSVQSTTHTAQTQLLAPLLFFLLPFRSFLSPPPLSSPPFPFPIFLYPPPPAFLFPPLPFFSFYVEPVWLLFEKYMMEYMFLLYEVCDTSEGTVGDNVTIVTPMTIRCLWACFGFEAGICEFI